MGEMAKYRELNRMFADKQNVRGHSVGRLDRAVMRCLPVSVSRLSESSGRNGEVPRVK